MNQNFPVNIHQNQKPDFILTYLVCYFLFFYLLFTGPRMFQDPDLLWHIGLGKDILTTGNVPLFDTYSWTLLGLPYVSKDWLSEIIFAFLYNHLGFVGIFLFCSTCIILTFGLLYYEISKKVPALLTLSLCSASLLLLIPHLLCRPHVLILPLLVVWCIGILRSTERGCPPSPLLIPILFFWSQMHGSFILGIVLLPFFFYESLKHRKPFTLSKIFPYFVFIIVALIVPILGPYGLNIYKGLFNQLALQDSLYFIKEWQPQDLSHLSLFQVVLLGAIGCALYSGFSLPLNRIIILILLLHMSLTHIRHTDFLALVTPLLLATPLSIHLSPKKKSEILLRANSKRFFAISLLLAIFVSCVVFEITDFQPSSSLRPEAALQTLKKFGTDERGLNSYDFGGYLILKGEKTYIDGRQDFFGPAFVNDYAYLINLTDASELTRKLNEKNIFWVLLKPNEKITQTMEQMSDWMNVYSDPYSSLYIRK